MCRVNLPCQFVSLICYYNVFNQVGREYKQTQISPWLYSALITKEIFQLFRRNYSHLHIQSMTILRLEMSFIQSLKTYLLMKDLSRYIPQYNRELQSARRVVSISLYVEEETHQINSMKTVPLIRLKPMLAACGFKLPLMFY